MSRQLFTAADIRRIALEQKATHLLIAPGDLITPEAADVARELGVQLIHGASGASPPPGIPGPARQLAAIPLPALKQITRGSVILDPFGKGLAAPGTDVRLKDVVTSADGSSIAAGYMSLEKGEFRWTLTYDEIDIILEGELVITRAGQSVTGKPGDVIFVPKGSSITFGTPSFTRFIYVAYPADWNQQE